MSVATEIARIQTDKATIRSKMVELGRAQSTDGLDELATAVAGIENQGAVSATVKEGETYAIPKGYHNGSGTVSGVAGGGDYGLQSKSVTPTKLQQNITPDSGYYGLSDVTVAPIPENYNDVSVVTAEAGDVIVGKIFVDSDGAPVVGTIPVNNPLNIVLPTQDNEKTYTIPEGYHNGEGTVKIVEEEKTVTPTETEQVVTPSAGKVLSSVTVERIPTNYQDASSATASAADILSGKKAFGPDGQIVGTMANNGALNGSIDGLSTVTYNIPSGYTSGGAVSLTADIENALAEI